jgi:hypothetical protein
MEPVLISERKCLYLPFEPGNAGFRENNARPDTGSSITDNEFIGVDPDIDISK